eukprot:gnl/TRDRNA2_/TRDRNA2_182897_c0_seq1.p1 gnl/TRDRNA2_/TRDRNA2_182897_c0~~gnl/TRDRNA2_/TRDRNA2_182897_c0_seq1.p1  ORF type:complete len:448 (-),score=84.21 gnl/TRDRNA2_/TRDRNA2_182897_c0_seq1:84-1427(-)
MLSSSMKAINLSSQRLCLWAVVACGYVAVASGAATVSSGFRRSASLASGSGARQPGAPGSFGLPLPFESFINNEAPGSLALVAQGAKGTATTVSSQAPATKKSQEHPLVLLEENEGTIDENEHHVIRVNTTDNSAGAGVAAAAATASKLNSTGSIAANASSAVGKAKQLPPVVAKSWFSMVTFALVIKSLCMMSNVMFQASPLPQIQTFYKDKDTSDTDPAPFISILGASWQWCFYGTFAFLVTAKSGFLVLVYSNVVGASMGLFYIYGFQCNCHNEKCLQKLHMYYQIVGAIVLFQVAALCSLPWERALFFSGLVSSLCSMVSSVSLLSTVGVIFETKCSKSINEAMLGVSMISSTLWIICGVILSDAWIICPNCISVTVNLFTVGLCIYFPRDVTQGNQFFPPVDEKVEQRSGDCVADEASTLMDKADVKGRYGTAPTAGTGESW